MTLLIVKGPVPLEDVLYQVKKSSRIAAMQVVDADAILNEEHVMHAMILARRAFQEGRNQADQLEVEFVRYLSGERQIRKALDKVGAKDESTSLALVGFGDKGDDAIQHFAHALGLPATTLGPRDEAWLRNWGIDDAMLAATTPARRMELVFERVAAVELMK